MCYHCDKCNEVQFGKENKVTTEIRNVNYNQFTRKKNPQTKEIEENLEGTFVGFETVTEQRYCDKCYETYKDAPPTTDLQTKEVKFFIRKRYKPTVQNNNFDEADEKNIGD